MNAKNIAKNIAECSMEHALVEHTAIRLTCIKRYSVLKTNFDPFIWVAA